MNISLDHLGNLDQVKAEKVNREVNRQADRAERKEIEKKRKMTTEVQRENFKKQAMTTKNSRAEALSGEGKNETYYTTIKMPCLIQPDNSETIKQLKTAAMKNNLDEHIEEKKKRMTSVDFLGMNDKEILMNKSILTQMGIL